MWALLVSSVLAWCYSAAPIPRECHGGPEVPFPPGCEGYDLDGDGDVDQDDFAIFQRCFSGTVSGDVNCAD